MNRMSADTADPPKTGAHRTGFPSRRFYLILLMVLALAAVLRLTRLGQGDFWLDELASLASSAGRYDEMAAIPHGLILRDYPRYTDLTADSTLGAVWHEVGSDTHPPTYFMLLWGWRRIFGDAEIAVRSLNVVFSLLSIVPLALIFRERGRPTAGLWAAMLLAVAYADIRMSQQARPYTLSLCLVLFSTWALVRMEMRWESFARRQKLLCPLLYAMATALAMLTHYFAGLAFLAQATYAGFRFRGPLLRVWLISLLLAAVIFSAIWMRPLLDQRELIGRQHWLLEQHPDHVSRTLQRAADLPIRLLVQSFAGWDEEYQVSPARSAIGVVLVVGVLVIVWRKRCREAWLFALWYLVAPLAFLVIDLSTGRQMLTFVRYPLIALPGIIGLIVLAAERLPGWAGRLVLGGLTIIALIRLDLPTGPKPEARQGASYIQQMIGPDDLIIYDAVGWPSYWASQLHALISYHLPPPGHPTLLLRDPPSPELQEQMRAFERIALVCPPAAEPPDPAPGSHRLMGVAPYVHHVGWVCFYTATAPERQPGSTAP